MFVLLLLLACPPADKESETTTPALQDVDGDGVDSTADCDDGNAAIKPGAEELCDGIDNDCSGIVDDVIGNTYVDVDADGYGDPASPADPCDGVADHSDCDDTNAEVHPDATEICNALDDDCDDQVDGQDPSVVGDYMGFVDADGDGFGDDTQPFRGCETPGITTDGGDCEDKNPAVNPGVKERCDGQDNNCNGLTDDEETGVLGTSVFHEDGDADGFGNPDRIVEACVAPASYGTDASDCDDENSAIYPGAPEHCDLVDEDCDGVIDNDPVDVCSV